MRIRKTLKEILRQRLTASALVILFFTVITVTGLGAEKVEAEKAFSQYSKSFNNTYLSTNLKKLLIINKDFENEEEDISYWDIDGKEDPVLIWEQRKKFEILAERHYSPDLKYYAEPKGNTIYLKRMEDDLLVNKIVVPNNSEYVNWHIKISNDNSKLVVLNSEYIDEGKTYIRLFDIKSGKLISDIDIYQDSGYIYGFSFDDKYINFSYSLFDNFYTSIYSVEEDRIIFEDLADQKRGYSFIKEDLIYVLNNIGNNNSKSVEIIDISLNKGEVLKSYNNIENNNTQMVTEFLGSNYIETTFNELIAVGDRLEKYKKHEIEDKYINLIAYNKEKKEWLIVGQNKIHYIPTKANGAKESFEKYTEAVELLELGFEEGVDRLKESLIELPSTLLAHNNGKFLNTEYDLTLKERAELVLAEYNLLMAADSRSIIGFDGEFTMSPMGYKIKLIGDYSDLSSYPEIKQDAVITAINAKAVIPGRDITAYYSDLKAGEKIKLTINQGGINKDYNIRVFASMVDNYDLLYVHRKLFEYGLLAVRAGYPQLGLEAAQKIRDLELMYPNGLLWDKVDKHIILLEALATAVRDGSEAGFKYILANDGILFDDNNNYLLNIYLNDYPEYFVPLLKDRKKMSYFTAIAENELPSVQIWQPEKLDFIDLAGNEIAGVEADMGYSSEAAFKDEQKSKSVGTVLD